jgi:vitamin B12 transporter
VAPVRQVTLLAGLDREWSTAKTDDGELDQRLLAVYAEAQLNPVEPLHFTAGVRADNYNTFGHATTYRFTGAWEVKATGTTLRASIGSGFMPPSLTARFGSVFQNPNPEIRPEHSRGWDVGAEQELPGGRGRIAVSWFHNHLRDLIGFETAPFPALGRSVNIDRARTEGLEVSSRLRVGILEARTAYTLLSATSPSEPDPAFRRLIRRPRHTVSADAVFALPKRARVGGGVVALLDREDTDFNTFPSQRVDPGNYVVARLYGSWEMGPLTFQARVENLFDERYEPVYGFPALGRSVTGSMLLRF